MRRLADDISVEEARKYLGRFGLQGDLALQTIEAMAMALNEFEGGVVLVSHDERLIDLVADELWVVDKGVKGKPGKVTVFDGSFREYRDHLEREFEKRNLIGGDE